MEIRHSHFVLDTCCILNFCLSGHLIEILKSIPSQAVVTEVVKESELLTLKRLNDDNHHDIDEVIRQFELAIEQDVLKIVDFNSEDEAITFINYAAAIGGDGESATGAIAFHREWAIATDDKKAISFFKREVPHLQILSTPDIIKHWSEESKVVAPILQVALIAIRTKGRYAPPRNHPLQQWWKNMME